MANKGFEIHGKKVRLLYLDNFYESSKCEQAQKLFGSILNWKILGYRSRYEASFIPVDQSDYFSRHYVFCFEESDGSLSPFSGQRYISLNRCLEYNSLFPLLSTVKSSACEKNLSFINHRIDDHIERKVDMIYPSGYTLNRNLSGQKEFSSFGAETTAAIHYFEKEMNPESSFITASVVRFKTYRLLRDVGHQFSTWDGEELPSFSKRQAGNEELKLMHLNKLTRWTVECYDKLEQLFDNALIVKRNVSERVDRAA